jgi:hypothetical protein
MKTFTGNKDIDLKILENLEDTDFPRVCEVNKYVNKLCQNDVFWLNRFLLRKPFSKKELDNIRKNINKPVLYEERPSALLKDISYRKLYEYLYLNTSDFQIKQKQMEDIIKMDNIYLYKKFKHTYNFDINPKELADKGAKNIISYELFAFSDENSKYEFIQEISKTLNIDMIKWLETMDIFSIYSFLEEAFKNGSIYDKDWRQKYLSILDINAAENTQEAIIDALQDNINLDGYLEKYGLEKNIELLKYFYDLGVKDKNFYKRMKYYVKSDPVSVEKWIDHIKKNYL